jgi:cobalt-zinc-cadmium efflux system membrane fusion protein
VTSLRIKHAAAAVSAIGLLTGAWLLMRTSEAPPARAAQTTANADVNVKEQYLEITEKQAEAFKVMPAEPRPFKVLKNAVGSISIKTCWFKPSRPTRAA